MRKIYEFMRQPPYWIVHDDDGYWLVPVRPDGWQARTPFVGRVTGLREVSDVRERDLGLPDLQG